MEEVDKNSGKPKEKLVESLELLNKPKAKPNKEPKEIVPIPKGGKEK